MKVLPLVIPSNASEHTKWFTNELLPIHVLLTLMSHELIITLVCVISHRRFDWDNIRTWRY